MRGRDQQYPSGGSLYGGDVSAIERERLRKFDMPNSVSVAVVGEIGPGKVFLDVGSGENSGLRDWVTDSGGRYIGMDQRVNAVGEQHIEAAVAIVGDAKQLILPDDACDVVHGRFLLAHFADFTERMSIVNEAYRVTVPGGRVIFIDYDWSTVSGSPAMERLRDIVINNISISNATQGYDSLGEIRELMADRAESVEQSVPIKPPRIYDYGPAIALRDIMNKGLAESNADQEIIVDANDCFDRLEAEASLSESDRPGFFMPDMVAVIIKKPMS